jgi:hypothetical protein
MDPGENLRALQKGNIGDAKGKSKIMALLRLEVGLNNATLVKKPA